MNVASKVETCEANLAEELKLRKQLLNLVFEQDIQLLQMPCPEFMVYGSRRWGMVKEQFLTPHYQQACLEMFTPIFQQIEEYLSQPNKFKIIGIVSVEGSPSCGYKLTCRGDWGGEFDDINEISVKLNNVSLVAEPGVAMAIIAAELEKRRWPVPILTMAEIVEKLADSNQS